MTHSTINSGNQNGYVLKMSPESTISLVFLFSLHTLKKIQRRYKPVWFPLAPYGWNDWSVMNSHLCKLSHVCSNNSSAISHKRNNLHVNWHFMPVVFSFVVFAFDLCRGLEPGPVPTGVGLSQRLLLWSSQGVAVLVGGRGKYSLNDACCYVTASIKINSNFNERLLFAMNMIVVKS